ncbi:hypothetical protein OF83DRAFT_1226103 [Amylostereum chailletii]|nr:hypothetical protein OF83DRAFT_1226103 [Amylostereum chailletii]
MFTEVSRQLRLLLEDSPQAIPPPEVYSLVDAFVLDCSASPEPEVLLYNLEEELQAIHGDAVDHDSCQQTEIFLTVLYHLIPILPSSSLISTWFDLVLRPALRDPKLPSAPLAYAKDLVLTALEQADNNYPDKQGEFRRRILDLYLLDAYNEGADDVVEWAELPEDQREKRALWKSNLEDVLMRFGLDQPEALFTQVLHCFASPTSRLQLLRLLNNLTSEPDFDHHADVLAFHPLMSSILTSLLVDNSTTVCTIGLTLITKLLPIFAVNACEALKGLLPRLFAILARIICWRERRPEENVLGDSEGEGEGEEPSDEPPVPEAVEGSRAIDTRPDLEWQRLELSFKSAAPAPSPKRYFTGLYYLFPCNIVAFLRRPAAYLSERNAESPYVVDWDEALDRDQIKTKSEVLLRLHATHPQIIWRNAISELEEPPFFAQYDVPRILTECTLLRVQNARLAHSKSNTVGLPPQPEEAIPEVVPQPEEGDDENNAMPSMEPETLIEQPRALPRVSLQDMMNTSIALKSYLDVDVVDPTPVWPYNLFPAKSGPLSATPSHISLISSGESPESNKVPSHVAQAISALQREVLLLKNELNFESWLARENVKHIAKLYEHRLLSRHAEAERQGLHNKLREYKAQVTRLQKQLRAHKDQTNLAQSKHGDWNAELQTKLHNLREQKRCWETETAALRQAEQDLRANFAAQGRLLEEAEKRVFQLETSIKETAHKVTRLRDYEQRINELTALQRLWDADVHKYKEQTELIKSILSKHKKMALRLESYEQTHASMEEQARASRRQIQTLEAKLSFANARHKTARRDSESGGRAAAVAETSRLTRDYARLREENNDLKDQVDDLTAMLEVLRAQVDGRTGLLVDPSRSPLLTGSPALHL